MSPQAKSAINDEYFKPAFRQDQMGMLFRSRKKSNPNGPGRGHLPPCSTGLTGWSGSAEQTRAYVQL